MQSPRSLAHPDLLPALGASTVAGLGAATVLYVRPTTSAMLIAALALLSAAPIVVRVTQGRFDPFEPMFIFVLAWAGMFVVRPLAMLHYNEFSYIWAPGISLRPTFDRMLLMALLGEVAFLLGYLLPAGARFASKAPRPPSGARTSTVTIIALGAAALGLVLFGLYILQAGTSNLTLIFGGQSSAQLSLLGRANKYFVLGPILLVGSTVVIFAMALDRRRAWLFALFAALLAMTWVIWNSVGSRTVLFPMFGALWLFWYVRRNQRPAALTLVLVLFLAVFVSAVIGSERYATIRQQQGISGVVSQVASHPSLMFDPLLRGSDNAMAPGLAAAMTIVPSRVHYDYGWSVLRDLLVRPIPRSLWPGKPLPPREALVAMINPTGFQTHTANPESSNLLLPYLSWGLFGAAFLVLYGVAARLIGEWFKLYRHELSAQLVFALLIPLMLTSVRDGLVDLIALTALLVLPVWMVFSLGRIKIGR